MNYRIEKGIPIPQDPPRESNFFDLVYSMEIGDSVVCKYKDEPIRIYILSSKKNFKVAQINKEECRIWRIK